MSKWQSSPMPLALDESLQDETHWGDASDFIRKGRAFTSVTLTSAPQASGAPKSETAAAINLAGNPSVCPMCSSAFDVD
jgi:hypothetical protein